jgi:hypothetical protein
MSRLILIWFDICLLRAGPQDLPTSRELLGLAMASYALVSFLLSLPGYPLVGAGQLALMDAPCSPCLRQQRSIYPARWRD